MIVRVPGSSTRTRCITGTNIVLVLSLGLVRAVASTGILEKQVREALVLTY